MNRLQTGTSWTRKKKLKAQLQKTREEKTEFKRKAKESEKGEADLFSQHLSRKFLKIQDNAWEHRFHYCICVLWSLGSFTTSRVSVCVSSLVSYVLPVCVVFRLRCFCMLTGRFAARGSGRLQGATV